MSKTSIWLSAVSLMLILSGSRAVMAQQERPDDITVLANARLITGDGSVLENAFVVIQGESILSVSTQAPAGPSGEYRYLDLAGKTLMPALIDAHAHLGYEGYGSWGSLNYSRGTMIEHLQRYAYYGFGAVFSAGSDPDDFALELQAAQARGEFVGARFLFAAGMAPPGQGPNDQFLGHALAVAQSMDMTILRGLETPEQARFAVREVAAKGIRFVKLWVDDRGGSQEKLAASVYRAAIAEANLQGLQVFVHQQYAEDMTDLISAGTDGFLHGRIGESLSEVIAEQSRQADVFIIPNLGLGELRREAIGEDEFLQRAVPTGVAQRLSSSAARQVMPERDSARELALQQGFQRLLDADVDIVLGTDAGAVPDHFFGYTGHRELEIFVRLGMTPMQALRSGTSVAAKRLGLNDMGVIEAGYSADLVVLDANPLDDIRNTQTISRVFLKGREIDRQSLQQGFSR